MFSVKGIPGGAKTSTSIVIVLILFAPVTLSFVNSSADANTSDGTTPLSFEPKGGSDATSLEQTIIQGGESAQVPLQSKLSENYALTSMDLSLEDVPNDINAWIVPNVVPQTVNSRHLSADAELQIYADSNAPPGNYTIKIVGTGLVRNQATGEDVQLTNETLGLLHLTIMPATFYQSITMDIGEPKYENKELCVDDDSSPGDGKMCLGFAAQEEFPISVSYSSAAALGSNEVVSLTALGVPEGAWAKFVLANFSLNSVQGATGNSLASGKLLLAGAVKPFGGFPPDTQPIVIRASLQKTENEQGSPVAVDYLPIVRTGNLTILHDSTEGISFTTQIINNVNGTNFAYYGAVYDPIEDHYDGEKYYADSRSGKSLQVTLSVAGIAKKGSEERKEVSPMPSWLRADIPTSSFVLNASQPYYFVIKTTTSTAPVGDYLIVIDETIRDGQDGQQAERQFRGYVPLTIWPPMYVGPASAPADSHTGNNDEVAGNSSTNANSKPSSSMTSSTTYKLSWSREVKGTFTSVDISDDKSYLAVGSGSGDKEGAVYLYNIRNGDLLWNYDADRRISSALISSDSSHLAAAGFQFSGGPGNAYMNGAIYYFDVKTGQLLWNRTTGSEPVMSFSISSDGSHLAVGTNQNVLYYDSEGRLLWNQTTDGSLDGITMSPDGSFLFVAASSVGQPKNPNDEWGGYLIDGKTGAILWNYTGTEAPSAEMPAISSDGKYVTVGAALSGYNGFVYLFDRESGDLLWKHQINSPALSASISQDGSALAVSTNWALLFFDGKTGNLLWNHTGDASSPSVSQMKMTPDARYIVGGVWGGGTGKDIQLLAANADLLWSYPAGTVYSVDISDDGSIIGASASSTFLGEWQNSPSTIYLFERRESTGAIDTASDYLSHLGIDMIVASGGPISFIGLVGLAAAGSVAAVFVLRRIKRS